MGMVQRMLMCSADGQPATHLCEAKRPFSNPSLALCSINLLRSTVGMLRAVRRSCLYSVNTDRALYAAACT